jgi:hypothetical protein
MKNTKAEIVDAAVDQRLRLREDLEHMRKAELLALWERETE